MGLGLEVAGKTDVGCVRSNNEDALGYSAKNGVFVVCDGVGGQASGEVASQIGVETVLRYFDRATREGQYEQFGKVFEGVSESANALASAIQIANDEIRRAAAANPARTGMGSTIAAGVMRDSHVSIAHVGDSRVYLLRDGRLQQLTRDHSFVMEQVARGLISEEEAERSPAQNYILRALGAQADVEPDIADLELRRGDILLLSSDGLTRHVHHQQMAHILSSAASLEKACEDLIDAAKRGGGSDNITCVLVRVVEQHRAEGDKPDRETKSVARESAA